MTSATSLNDLLHGVPAIAAEMRLSPRQIYHLAEKHGLPTFKIGRTVCARRSTLSVWLAEREAAARSGRADA
ncbi:hypothetical protein MEX01_28490 [Methylorubrum extorquens]|uniref:DNA-binding protein n=1 Tax=Methylorubrum extorquens TaxID=408 RepID=UPI0011697307|nr:DNA-binding protein [Methylorubrum extorquens]GEL42258.1 hypothetical protein MEX01_28490 [Methylorubrum extorquens]